MKITIEEVRELAKSEGLCVIEDFKTSLSGNGFTFPITTSCLTEPPYTSVYDKEEVESVIKLLKKFSR